MQVFFFKPHVIPFANLSKIVGKLLGYDLVLFKIQRGIRSWSF